MIHKLFSLSNSDNEAIKNAQSISVNTSNVILTNFTIDVVIEAFDEEEASRI